VDAIVVEIAHQPGRLEESGSAFEGSLIEQGSSALRSWRAEDTRYVVLPSDASEDVVRAAAEVASVRLVGAAQLVVSDEFEQALEDVLPEQIDYELALPTVGGPITAAALPPISICERCFGIGSHIGPPCIQLVDQPAPAIVR